MIAQKYILATTGAGSTCNSVIEGKLGACFEEENIEGIQQHILFYWQNVKQNTIHFLTKTILTQRLMLR
ncbi:MAG: hypothetical protein IPJ22_03010 [Bacteroidetes bacterium]|nr:hypothetical protein [Bacteroidota bacterium]